MAEKFEAAMEGFGIKPTTPRPENWGLVSRGSVGIKPAAPRPAPPAAPTNGGSPPPKP